MAITNVIRMEQEQPHEGSKAGESEASSRVGSAGVRAWS